MRPANIVFINYLFVVVIGATLDELKEALHTRQKVWTTLRSYHVPPRGHKHKCIYFEEEPARLRKNISFTSWPGHANRPIHRES
uniref:Lipocalin n=1 Tax=Rhipicephalus appendiculatus TaxID=34631 RepID=A0A131YH98_RHIAP